MIIVDKALEKLAAQHRPIRVAIIGMGFMGKGIAQQVKSTVGMKLVDLTDSPDAVVEATGSIEYGSHVVMDAIKMHQHVILMNAELDGTLGPILKKYADREGVVYTAADGDQPGVTMNLYRFVKGLGLQPVMCGNIKTFHDPYKNPTTQAEWAKKTGQKASMITAFTDGTKISFEQATIANGTGMRVGKRGMYGPRVPIGTSIQEAVDWYTLDEPIVDYVIGASPAPGVFVIGHTEDIQKKAYLDYYKMGKGPFYVFHVPYHLCHFEVPSSIARAVLFQDATLAPLAGPVVDVITTAKMNLAAGQVLDGIGQYMTYGQCENSDVTSKEKFLPMGLSQGCVLQNDISKDQVLTYADVILPEGRLEDKLREEQNEGSIFRKF